MKQTSITYVGVGYLLNTSYMTDLYVIFTLKMDSASKNTIFALW